MTVGATGRGLLLERPGCVQHSPTDHMDTEEGEPGGQRQASSTPQRGPSLSSLFPYLQSRCKSDGGGGLQSSHSGTKKAWRQSSAGGNLGKQVQALPGPGSALATSAPAHTAPPPCWAPSADQALSKYQLD